MAARAVALICLLLLTGACGESQSPEELQDTEELMAAGTESTISVYRCDNGERVQSRYESRTDELVLFLTDRAVRLRHVESASGAKYSAAGITFWNKGDSALLQRAGNPDSECRQTE